ncbi:MAG: DNA mismatch repair protein MutS [Victivallales bacterium]|nr:DNA mismatch repair protein MutS [Victivallales bacterium]
MSESKPTKNASLSGELTPGMRQYAEAKRQLAPDTLLMFRMGDFYEMFFEDAKIAAPLMDVVLTSRAGAPLCGIPYRAVRQYVPKLLAGGYKVALADQIEDPKLAKGLVKRDITEIITPGTMMEDTLLESNRSNYLVALLPMKNRWGLASLDLSTAEFRITEIPMGVGALEVELNRLKPAECLAPASLLSRWQNEGFPADLPQQLVWTSVEDWHFDVELARSDLLRHFQVASLDGYGCRGYEPAIGAAGAILHYAQNTLRKDAANLTAIASYQSDDCLVLDRISQRNLELVDPIFADGKDNTLISVLDKTITPMGARLLREWVLRPLKSKPAIEARLDAVEDLAGQPMLLSELRETLSAVRDIERTVTRLSVGTNASARDLIVLRRGLEELPGLKAILHNAHAGLLLDECEKLSEQPELVELIAKAVVDEPPVAVHDGGMIRDGFNADLDLLRRASTEGKDWIANYQLKEQERTGIKSLKVRFNKVFGYFIEISKSFLDLVPPEYMRKQTIVNGERFITPELKEIEDKVLGSDEKAQALEFELFGQLREAVVKQIAVIQTTARALANIDCLGALAEDAIRYNYTRPAIAETPILEIRDGRHPVLDAHAEGSAFVPNDCVLNTTDQQIGLITGPNMAGKSTYIRQVALLVLMAQMGSFIPASSATIGLADRIFTRVGAADDLSRGQSTFMVEMVETANILNHATPQSLIILDEIGRGTSTFDGLSLAWAIAEYLHDTPSAKARTLFATHYHELTDLPLTKPGIKNYNVLVKEEGESIMFLRKIVPGAADKSYGIHVARLAGIPKIVIDRADQVLTNLENNEFDEEDAKRPKLAETKRRGRRSPYHDPNQLTFDL